MQIRTLTYLALGLLALMGILLAFFISPVFFRPSSEKYISYNDVRGMAIFHKTIPYTLNFDQQNALIGFLNQSVPIHSGVENGEEDLSLNFDKLVIYPFNAKELVVIPVEYDRNHNLIFTMPIENRQQLMKDVSKGQMKHLINQTYDH